MLTPYAEEIIGIINVDFDATGQLLNIYSASIKYLGKNGNTTKEAYDSVRREVLYNILRVWYPHETGKANNDVSE
jgi:hypothetical protein